MSHIGIIFPKMIQRPVSYSILYKWLQNFAYSINFDFMVMIFAGVATLLVAIIAISYHVTKVRFIQSFGFDKMGIVKY